MFGKIKKLKEQTALFPLVIYNATQNRKPTPVAKTK